MWHPCTIPACDGYPHGIPERGLKQPLHGDLLILNRYPHGIPERGLKRPGIRRWCRRGYPHGIPERGLKLLRPQFDFRSHACYPHGIPERGLKRLAPYEAEEGEELSPWNPRKGIETFPHRSACPRRARYPHGIPERGLKQQVARGPWRPPRYPHGIP